MLASSEVSLGARSALPLPPVSAASDLLLLVLFLLLLPSVLPAPPHRVGVLRLSLPVLVIGLSTAPSFPTAPCHPPRRCQALQAWSLHSMFSPSLRLAAFPGALSLSLICVFTPLSGKCRPIPRSRYSTSLCLSSCWSSTLQFCPPSHRCRSQWTVYNSSSRRKTAQSLHCSYIDCSTI